MYAPKYPGLAALTPELEQDFNYTPKLNISGFTQPSYYHVYAVTAATLKVPGFTDKENTLMIDNTVQNIRQTLDMIFDKGKSRVIGIWGFHTNHVHELYIGVPLRTSFHCDLRTVVDTVGQCFEQSTTLLECCGTGIKTVFNFDECDEYMDKFRQTLRAYERSEANVH